jgi:riboflavin kinase/FMN adenylyltransferase
MTYAAVVNIGNNPTVGNDHVTIEAHLIDYQGDLYGKTITVAFSEYIRAERKFDSLQKLQEQIRTDIQSL